MNTQAWITHFERNTRVNDHLELPLEQPCQLPEAIRSPLATSLATFQLGESGTGSRLRRYARQVAPMENFRGYQRAIDLFVAEEQSHARLLARGVQHLGGKLLTQQWTNSVFRRLRFLVNLEFAVQVLLTAELIAEVYFGTLYLRCEDPVVKKIAHKLLRDEMRHLEFQRDFLSERVVTLSPVGRWLWRAQFQAIHAITAAVVAWDHRRLLRALGLAPDDFRRRCLQGWRRFQQRLEHRLGAPSDEAATPAAQGSAPAPSGGLFPGR
ncbi:MAG: ferritin-like domain-containing protein [Prosthecobacter sp.]|jgi:hypothetical protein|nr:ferritin-like domain-containing protein [Prosthecobacter sp.]